MSYRSDWQTAKTDAKKANNNTAFAFPKDLKLGAALDKMEAAEKVYKKAGEKEHDAAWAKAADAYHKAASDANAAAVGYFQALPKLKVTDRAREILDTELTMNLMRNVGLAIKDMKRIEPMLAKARKAK